MRVRKIITVLAVVLGILAALGMGLRAAARQMLYQPIRLSEPQLIEIGRKASFGYVARRLQERGLVPNARALRLYARVTGQDARMKPGCYEVVNGQRPVDIVAMLAEGRTKALAVTIPEGKWGIEIADTVRALWPNSAEDLRAAFRQPETWKHKVTFPIEGSSLEGYLFPDTYHLPMDVTGEQIVWTMLKRFEATCWKEYTTHPPTDGRSLRDVLILASLVEGEAKVAKERPIIAGVYMNRLRKRMLLQCDATVLYAMGRRAKRVLYDDLNLDSPYNTYKYAGLPVGPINNPGLDAFRAALHPAQTPYLYYVAQGDGSHIFSETLTAHNAAVAHVRRK